MSNPSGQVLMQQIINDEALSLSVRLQALREPAGCPRQFAPLLGGRENDRLRRVGIVAGIEAVDVRMDRDRGDGASEQRHHLCGAVVGTDQRHALHRILHLLIEQQLSHPGPTRHPAHRFQPPHPGQKSRTKSRVSAAETPARMKKSPGWNGQKSRVIRCLNRPARA